ncbi:NrtR DNA-binding winged helix domain-containing protein [Pontibacter sp. G13]|uniref:NUDIX hydrolase n=1 Tax=Pontibacter sp. G13 TaxID=3074898 RepID=UPI00288A12CF|nr:NUDIX domain-containing protein [Pontibacter sp. G13]WNJ19665.1 NUDIX domain-containing protein [Pontibacter sp. G13]
MSEVPESKLNSLSIDCVIFGFEDAQIKLLLIQRELDPHRGSWSLPGGFIKMEEGIHAASERILKEMTGVDNLYLEQLGAFGEVDRYPLKRVVTIAYYALIKPGNYTLNPGPDASEARWFPLEECPPLPFDHPDILQSAINTLQWKVQHQPIGFNLLPEKFTLLQLQELYEAILQVKLDKPNFRRKFTRLDLLEPLDEYQKAVSHRAARLYRFDEAKYKELTETGFSLRELRLMGG